MEQCGLRRGVSASWAATALIVAEYPHLIVGEVHEQQTDLPVNMLAIGATDAPQASSCGSAVEACCLGLVEACWTAGIDTSAQQVTEHWEGLVHLTTSLSPVQLAVATAVAASLMWNHGHWVVWISLSTLLFLGGFVTVLWQFIMIALTIVLYQLCKWLSFSFYLQESLRRWVRGGEIRRRWRLRQRLRRARTYKMYKSTAEELDRLDGKEEWREDPRGWNSRGVAQMTDQLREARKSGGAEECVRLLRTMMQRGHLQVDIPELTPTLTLTLTLTPTLTLHLQVDIPELHTECRIGTKRGITELRREQVTCLRWLLECGEAELGKAEKLEFFQRCSVCLGHTALCLSGGGSLAMHHMGVVKVRERRLPLGRLAPASHPPSSPAGTHRERRPAHHHLRRVGWLHRRRHARDLFR